MKHIRQILSAMTVQELGEICDRFAKQSVEESTSLTFENEEEKEYYITDKSYLAATVIRRFVKDGVYSTPKSALFKVTK